MGAVCVCVRVYEMGQRLLKDRDFKGEFWAKMRGSRMAFHVHSHTQSSTDSQLLLYHYHYCYYYFTPTVSRDLLSSFVRAWHGIWIQLVKCSLSGSLLTGNVNNTDVCLRAENLKTYRQMSGESGV